MGNVAEVAQQCAFGPFFNFTVEPGAAADRPQKVGQVQAVIRRSGGAAQLLAGGVIDLVAATANGQGAGLAMEQNVGRLAARKPAAAQALPGERFAAWKLVTDEVRVRRFLIVLKAIAPPGGSHAHRQINLKAPAA